MSETTLQNQNNQMEIYKSNETELENDTFRIIETTEIEAEFLSQHPESGLYYQAFQAAKIPEFQFRYLNIFKGTQLVSIVPTFSMKFYLANVLPKGFLSKLFGRISFNLSCVGHPASDFGRIHGQNSNDIMDLVIQYMRNTSSLLAFKGFEADLHLKNFHEAKGLPVAVQELDGQFWKKLSGKRKSNFKQKIEAGKNLNFEVKENLADKEIDRIYELYLNIYEKAEIRFEKLNRNYFANPCENYRYIVARKAGEIVAFAQCLVRNEKMVFRYVGVDYELAAMDQAYFNLFFEAISYAEQLGVREIDWGATSYKFKKMLGSKIIETSIYFQHKNQFLNWFLGKIKFIIEPTSSDLE